MKMNICVFFCGIFVSLMAITTSGNVVLIGKNVTLSFADIEATFGELKFDSFDCLFVHFG